MHRDDVLALAVIEHAFEQRVESRRRLLRPPVVEIRVAQRKCRVAPVEAGHLQQPARPELRKAAALAAHRVGKGQSVGEIEPADITRNRHVHAVLLLDIEA